MRKSINQLVPGDFIDSPIWQPVDDLEDPGMEIMPFQGKNFHMEEMYLVAAKFTLADGSEWEGYIRFSWGKPILLALAVSNTEFLYFAAERLAESEESHNKFARDLDKNHDDVFPIEYQTMVKLYLQSTVY